MIRSGSPSLHNFYLAVIAVAGVSLAAVPAAVSAGIKPTGNATTVAKAMLRDSSIYRNASFVNRPKRGFPTAIGTSKLVGFPRYGKRYGILSTGSTRIIEGENKAEDTGINNKGPIRRGARDVVVLRIGIKASASAGSCLSLGFRFMSDEFPEFTRSPFNDAFIAEVDKHSWNGNGTRSAKISAPNNFANARQGRLISINGTGNFAVLPDRARGTIFDAGTRRLRASTTVKPGNHSVYLSIFDQGDRYYDSAVFIDNLRVTKRVPCVSGASLD